MAKVDFSKRYYAIVPKFDNKIMDSTDSKFGAINMALAMAKIFQTRIVVWDSANGRYVYETQQQHEQSKI